MIALGSHVTFSHRAAVARRRGFNDYPKHGEEPHKPIWMWREWELTEPKVRVSSHREGKPQIMTIATPITFVEAEEFVSRPENGRYPVGEDRWENRNKSIFFWPQEGSGVVVGLKRKQFGQSHGSTGGGEDFDPGYFEPFGQVSLYIVKAELLGPEVYVPESCIHLVQESK